MSKPIPTSKHPAAVALGKLGKGRRKTMTPAAIEARQKTARTRRKGVLPLSDEERQLPPGPLGAGVTDEDVD
jgi:hypothetical protein